MPPVEGSPGNRKPESQPVSANTGEAGVERMGVSEPPLRHFVTFTKELYSPRRFNVWATDKQKDFRNALDS